MHWGDGQIVEEARFEGEHTQPAIQLMRFDTGPAAGTFTLRFCHFNHRGQFQRSPMMLSDVEVDRLAEAVAQTPGIRRLLSRIAGVGDSR
jgi:hypothetical protein